MNNAQLIALVDRLRAEPVEVEWLEFRQTQVQPASELGEYLSALSNSAALAHKPYGYLLLGIQDGTHGVTGTQYNLQKAIHKNQNLLFWTTRGLLPRVHLEVYEVARPDGRVVLVEVGSAPGQPVKFYGKAWIRISGSKTLLNDHPQKEAALWHPQYGLVGRKR